MAISVAEIGKETLQPREGIYSRHIGSTLKFLIVAILSVLFVTPFIWTVFSSLKTYVEIYSVPPTLFPTEWEWDNYVLIFTQAPFARFIYNTLVISSLAVLGATLSSSLVAYSFSRFRWPGRDIAFVLCLSTMMLPSEITLIPTYILFQKIKWIDTWRPLIVPAWFGGGAFNIFLMRQFLLTLPRDLDEAAMIDGAGPFRVLWQILLPLCKPVITTMVVIGFIWSWNNFMGPLIFLNTKERYPIAVGIRWFSGEANRISGFGKPTEQLMMAAATVATFPCVLLFILAQRYFVQGIATTGLKGAGA